MPYVNIKVLDDITPEQKEQLIARTTQVLADVLHKNPQVIMVVVDEVATDNWGIGGESLTRRRARAAEQGQG